MLLVVLRLLLLLLVVGCSAVWGCGLRLGGVVVILLRVIEVRSMVLIVVLGRGDGPVLSDRAVGMVYDIHFFLDDEGLVIDGLLVLLRTHLLVLGALSAEADAVAEEANEHSEEDDGEDGAHNHVHHGVVHVVVVVVQG